MKLQVTQENLTKALGSVARVASARNTLPILSNILIKTVGNRLCVAATDLNIAITHYIGTKIKEEGEITVPARLTQDLIGSLQSGVIDISLEGTKLLISNEKNSSVINGIKADDFPIMPQIKNGANWSLPLIDLKNALSQTVVAASNDDTRPILTGVNFHTDQKKLLIAATDGYRLAEKKLNQAKQEINITVPAAAINDLLRILDDKQSEVNITCDEQQILFSSGDAELTSRLIEGNYPDYAKLIPNKFSVSAKLDTVELLNIVKVSSLFARESAGSIVLDVGSDNKISINSIASQLGENTATATAETDGSGQITLNAKYMVDALNATNSKQTTIGFNNKLEPLVVKGEDDNYTHVIMPLKS